MAARGAQTAARGAETLRAGRMRAWRSHAYGGPAELTLDCARVPPLRTPDQVLVRVHAAGLNPLDAAMTRGYGARGLAALRALTGPPDLGLPLIAGREFLGRVERAGPAARLRPGARVWGVVPPQMAGAHAERVLVPDACAAPAPAALSDAQCGGAPYAALTACAALRAAGAVRRVLVLGLGGVGQAAVQLLAARGARVTVGCAPDQVELALELGAADALDRHAADYASRVEAGGPYCAALDCAGLGGAAAGRWPAARYVTLTSPLLSEMEARGAAAGALAAAGTLLAQNVRAGAACPPRVRWAYFQARAADLEELGRLANRGRFRVVVSRVFPWWRAAEAYAALEAGGARGKLVLDWTAVPPDEQP